MKKYESIAKIFGEQELCFLEDALAAFETPAYLSDGGQEQLQALKDEITMARRWRHQFGKSQH